MTSFAPIPGWPMGYVVDSDGNVYGPRGLLKPTARTKYGHARINYRGRGEHGQMDAHRAVYSAFHGPVAARLLVLHRNGDASDNRLSNLYAGTYKDNASDARQHGTDPRGERNPCSTLTDDVVRTIRTRYAAGGVSQSSLAAEFGVTQSTISKVVLGRSWTHVQ